jgi:hypothetical protein
MMIGAGVISVVAPTPTVRDEPEFHAVKLSAAGDPITDLIDVLQAAAPTVTALYDQFSADPFPVLQQLGENQIGYAENFPADAATIPTQIADNLQAAITAAFGPEGGGFVYGELPSVLAGIADYQALYQFGESAASGVILGEVGTVLSPILALNDNVQAIVGDLTVATPDVTAAFNELSEIPANITNAFLNGYGDIALGPLITALGPTAADYTVGGELPLGGLLSPAGTFAEALDLSLQYGPVCTVSPDGLSQCVESIADQFGGPVGPIASLEALSQDVAHAIAPTGTPDGLPDLTASLGGDLSTASANLTTEFSNLTTELLTSLTNFF